jgi:uncharacterized protein (DUF305 family)
MRKYLIGLSAAAIIAVAAGCSDGGDAAGMDHGESQTSEPSATQTEHNEQDIAFAQMMIPHHQQAVDMAKLAADKATDQKVKDLASRVEGAQDPEIQQMTSMLESWGASAESSMPGMDHSGMSGDGMMTEEEMGQLGQATGADFDRMWVQMMIKHHQGAVAMAKTEVEKGGDADAKALAQQIITAQEAEITQMQGMAG